MLQRAGTAAEMDEIVQKIFSAMTSCVCFAVRDGMEAGEDVHARIVFLRSCCRSCEISLHADDADLLVKLLIGSAGEDLRADVAGELCNMIAGGWKTRREADGSHMTMLAPQTGHGARAGFDGDCGSCFSGSYAFAEGRFTVRLLCAESH